MEYAKLCDSDYRFMCVVWDNAPVNSGELVKLCQEQLAGRNPQRIQSCVKCVKRDTSPMRMQLFRF